VRDAGADAVAAAALGRLARALGVDGVVATGARHISVDDESALHPIERAQMVPASAVRRREFASGRALLRHLLGEDLALPVGPDRRPVLPPGVRASLAHDRTLVVAALSRTSHVSSIGVDLESASGLNADDAALVLRDDERQFDAALAFCLKEATYKAWSAAGGRMLDHHDIGLSVDAGTFHARVLDTSDVVGAWARVEDSYLALVVQHDVVIPARAKNHLSSSE
jgi:4'-phosphopantetheinyl transferase EntD